MRRRTFIAALGGAAAWPLVARGQQPAMLVVGLLLNGSPTEMEYVTAPFRKALTETGNVEGRNPLMVYRWADDYNDRLPALAAELIDHHPAVIFAAPGASAAFAVKRLTSTIPIVFYTSGDAVERGLVANLNKPDGNLTGVSGVTNSLITKQLELLTGLAPKSLSFALLTKPASPNTNDLVRNMRTASGAIGRELRVVNASNEDELDAVFLALSENHAGGLIVPANSFFSTQRERITSRAASHRVPTIYPTREFVEAGGLVSYGVDLPEMFRELGVYTGKILGGVKPSDLPVFQPSKFELVINLQTAKALGLDVPPSLLARADEVIE
jgi:putative ABC transport system substrate-binding protein